MCADAQWTQYYMYLAEAMRLQASSFAAEAKSRACWPGQSVEDREYNEALCLNLEHSYKAHASRYEQLAAESLQRSAA